MRSESVGRQEERCEGENSLQRAGLGAGIKVKVESKALNTA